MSNMELDNDLQIGKTILEEPVLQTDEDESNEEEESTSQTPSE